MAEAQQLEPVEVARNPWGVILHHEDWRTLELRWLPGELSDDDFKETLTLFAQMGDQHKPRYMIVDAADFHHEFGPGVMGWRDRNIIPRYGAAGVTKFAFLVAPGVPGTVEAGAQPGVEDSASFPTGWFSTRERAYRWLAEA
ncbi:hypothetical protein ACIRRA_35445 [Nocardia sp. NPDC101769]|uniref:hypothetical protein n=1 Tax=Nocardia sp. NPDC101769 TaxID=3364333 RepID=UPI0038015954